MLENDKKFIYGLVLFVIIAFIIRATLDYKNYKNSINKYLFGSYLFDYYLKYFISKDVSRSQAIKSEVGTHRIVFAQIKIGENQIAANMFIVFHHNGVSLFLYMNPHGSISGNDRDKNWIIKRKEGDDIKGYKIDNPIQYLRTYETHIKEVTGINSIDKFIAIGGDDTIKLNIPYSIVRYTDVIQTIKESNSGVTLSEEEIENAFKKLSGQK